MKRAIKYAVAAVLAVFGCWLLSSWAGIPIHALQASAHSMSGTRMPSLRFPYRQAGLTERQAAAHLLSRFTYGATPGQVDEVVAMGLEKWFREQLEARQPDDSLDNLLNGYDALKLSNTEIANTFPRGGELLRMAVRDGVVDKDSVKTDLKNYRAALQQYMQDKGYKPEQELYRQFINQKVLRAAYSNNQLLEVMTDFWFNHFNVSITKNDCAEFIPDYERDVVRPGALGHFGDLLLATAKSPAMLYYLDNFNSSAATNRFPQAARAAVLRQSAADGQLPRDRQLLPGRQPNADRQPGVDSGTMMSATPPPVLPKRPPQGLNENYAREVMELHTLGVDGGYTQQDVTEAARVLTGWTVYPMGVNGKNGRDGLNRLGEDRMQRLGFVHEGDFLFNANRHDIGEKTVLGRHFGPDGGYQEGVQLLDMLAHHPSTAHFIARKIAVRFVNDDPPAALVDRLAKIFLDKNGDIRELLMTMVASREFWNAQALREKTKSPFELAIGAVRSLHATILQPYQLYNWVSRMGERKYYYQAPTGFPDKGAYWINTGSLLYRMNFGLALASGRIPGVTIDLAALTSHHEPESAQAALVIYAKLILPERDLDPTIRRLEPMLNDPNLEKKVDAATARNDNGVQTTQTMRAAQTVRPADNSEQPVAATQTVAQNSNPMLAQVVGIIIGSPEFQRR